MADHRKLIPHLLKAEGGFVNDPLDKGGATYKGVTLKTFRQFYGANQTVDDLKRMTNDQWGFIFKSGYWDAVKGDKINSQGVANVLVDWSYNSGATIPVKRTQRILGVTSDGIMGDKTLAAINNYNPRLLFEALKDDRVKFYNEIVARDGTQRRFLNGWLNRVRDIPYQ